MSSRWKYSVGSRPHTVTVYERPGRSSLYVRVWDPTRRGGEGGFRKEPLGHSDREKAKAQAAEKHAKLVKGQKAIRQGDRLSRLFALYKRRRTPKKGERQQKADARRMELWTRHLGAGKDPHKIFRSEWERLIELRSTGAIDARGKPVPETAPCPDCEAEPGCERCDGSGEIDPRQPVRPNTVRKDCQFLLAVLNWGANWQTEKGYVLEENVCRGFEVPKEKNPRRRVATDSRVRALRDAAPKVEMEVRWHGEREVVRSHLPALFELAVETGRRLSAIRRLRYSDLLLDRGPDGSIRWRAEEDKEKQESVVPISPQARRALERHTARMRALELPGIGDAPLFPAPGDPSKPTSRHLADKWLRRAEELAELEPQEGTLWHAYRRRWATAKKHLPATDVAAAGGWKGPETLEKVYQQADPDTMYEVVTSGGEVREVSG